MTDLLLQIALSNAVVSAAMALVAIMVQRTLNRPQLAYLLWLLVIIKLVTPPLVTLPVMIAPGQNTEPLTTVTALSESGINVNLDTLATSPLLHPWWIGAKAHGKSVLLMIWLTGGLLILSISLIRIFRFNRLLNVKSEKAPPSVQKISKKMTCQLKIRSEIAIYTTSANLTPMVWWVGGRARVILPKVLLEKLGEEKFQWVIAHELAHIRRRDHLVRWVEWLACVCFWWNPLAWMACRHLRINEEICCDALVLTTLNPKPNVYATSLLETIEQLAETTLRPPAVASAIDSGGILKRRFDMILSKNTVETTSRKLKVAIILGAMAILPLGFASAEKDTTDTDKVVVKDKVVIIDKDVKKINHSGKELSKKKQYRNKEDNAHLKTWTLLKSKVDADEMTMEEARKEMGEVKKAAAKAKAEAHRAEMKTRIDKALEEGEITQEQADAKLARLDKSIQQRMKMAKRGTSNSEEASKRLEGIWTKMQEKVKAGEMTEEEANIKMTAMKKRIKEGKGRGNQDLLTTVKSEKVVTALKKMGITKDQLEGTTKGMTRMVYGMQKQGDDYQMGERMEQYLVKDVGLNKEQMDNVERLCKRIAMSTDKKTKRAQKENSGIGEIRAEPPRRIEKSENNK
jgi:beta-lactamase regulating signal transducer with metallopeptidase domain